MKITDLQLNESLTQEGMWDSLKGKLARTPAQPMQQRQEPVMTPEPAQAAVWKNARNPGAPAATSPQAAAPSTAPTAEPTAPLNNNPADVEPEEPAPAVEPAAAVNTRPKGPGFLTRLGQELRGRAQQNQVSAANKEMVNSRVNAWKQASQGLDPNNTQAYQKALETWATKNFPNADPAVIKQAAASVTPKGWGSNSQQVQAITDIFNNHITNKQIGKAEQPLPQTTSSTAGEPSKVTYSGLPQQKVTPNYNALSATANAGYKTTQPTVIPTVAATPAAPAQEPAAPKTTKVITGGPTPDERAKLDQRIQQLAQTQTTESVKRDFGAMLWKQMRDSK